jgi:uncharacterized protein
MDFINRTQELEILNNIQKLSLSSSKMTFVVGRRRIGKTTLLKHCYSGSSFIYLFVSKKTENLLCEEFITVIASEGGFEVFGNFTKFKDLFAYLLNLSKSNPFTLVIDEFQELGKINNSIYSDMQNLWDSNKNFSKMNLILCGSVYSLIKKIFEDNKEPLFGRADRKIIIKPFKVPILKEILLNKNLEYNPEDLLAFYILTGGIAKYTELFYDEEILTLDSMLNSVFRPGSLFLDEGRNVLIEEFGKDYGTYFSILSLLASSKTSRSEIESILERNIGGYLNNLENEYAIIKKVKPINAKPGSRTQKYFIDDNFLNFWFRFIYKYQSALEIENFELVKKYTKDNFIEYSGRFLEKFFREIIADSNKYTIVGNYWENGNKNEIDIVALNEFNKTALIAEVKLNPAKISIPVLKKKSFNLVNKLKNYNIEYKGFSLGNLKEI